jgi:hypothetical protein
LSAEREYTRSTLPRGVARELRCSMADPAGLLRAATIVAGLAITAGGYLSGRARHLANTPAGVVPMRPLATTRVEER